jgi:energy-coupling factor transporter ATP-binding protein EcfA2
MNDETINPLRLQAMTLRGIGSYVLGSRLEIRPLTILCGTNGSGKSTWLNALNLLAKSNDEGLLPFGFYGSNAGSWTGPTNAMVNGEHNAAELLRDEEADVKFGPLGTIGLEFVATKDFALPDLAIRTSQAIDSQSPSQSFLWEGRCREGTRFRLRLAHPEKVNPDEGQDLEQLIEIRLNNAFILRLSQKRWRTLYYEVTCSRAFLPGNTGDEAIVHVAEIKTADNRNFAVENSDGSEISELERELCDLIVARIRQLLKLLLSGYFYLGAIREVETRETLEEGVCLADRIESARITSRLKELAGLDRAEEIDALVVQLKGLEGSIESIDTENLIRRRYVGSRGEATHDLGRSFAYNLMRQFSKPYTGNIDQSFRKDDIGHIRSVFEFWSKFEDAIKSDKASPQRRVWDFAGPELQSELSAQRSMASSDYAYDYSGDLHRTALANLLNGVLWRRDLYEPGLWSWSELDNESQFLIDREIENLHQDEVHRLNRLLIEAAFPEWPCFVKHKAGFLFETYVSFWLEKLLDVRINLFVGIGSLSESWMKANDPPSGFLVHKQPQPQTLRPKWMDAGDDEPGNLNRYSTPSFRMSNGYFTTPGFLSVGYHQVAPMVVQTGLMRRFELLAIENPEAHLHPSLQLEVAGFFIEQVYSAKEQMMTGKFILIETHSDLIVRRVLRAIIQEDIRQSHVGINFVDSSEEVHGYRTSKLEPLTVDDRGGVQNWPDGFMDADIREARRLLDITYGQTDEEGDD